VALTSLFFPTLREVSVDSNQEYCCVFSWLATHLVRQSVVFELRAIRVDMNHLALSSIDVYSPSFHSSTLLLVSTPNHCLAPPFSLHPGYTCGYVTKIAEMHQSKSSPPESVLRRVMCHAEYAESPSAIHRHKHPTSTSSSFHFIALIMPLKIHTCPLSISNSHLQTTHIYHLAYTSSGG
jgi:hypothetical protein